MVCAIKLKEFVLVIPLSMETLANINNAPIIVIIKEHVMSIKVCVSVKRTILVIHVNSKIVLIIVVTKEYVII
jgi:hypothetical protein